MASTAASSRHREPGHRSRAIGGAIEGGVVDHDRQALGRAPHVALEPIGAGGEPARERRHGVLGPELGTAAMREHQWPLRRRRPPAGNRARESRRHNSHYDQDGTARDARGPQGGGGARRDRQALGEGRSPHNLIAKLRAGDRLFPGVVGYDETVIPQLVNAILAKHHFILLGLRGQAKTRLMRALVDLLDEVIPVVPGSEIHDDPLAPLSAHGRALVATEGDDLPIEWRPREARYVEKLATPDVTIADLIGDIDPIKAAKSGLQLGSELAMHFGLLPRANRGPVRHQRAARPGQQGASRPVQHPPGGRRPDQRLPGAAAARRDAGLHGQPGGLHGARQDHHAAQGPHRRRDPHPLPGVAGASDGGDHPGSVGGARA